MPISTAAGLPNFLNNFDTGLGQRGTASGRIHKEAFGPGESMRPGIARSSRPAPHPPFGAGSGLRPLGVFHPERADRPVEPIFRKPAATGGSPATYRCDGHVESVYATPVRDCRSLVQWVSGRSTRNAGRREGSDLLRAAHWIRRSDRFIASEL